MRATRALQEERSIDRIAVPQQILGGGVVGECIYDLLRGPRCRRCISDVEPKNGR